MTLHVNRADPCAARTDKSWRDDYDENAPAPPVETADVEPIFGELFRRHLTVDPRRSALEIGCANGRFLAHLHRRYGLEAHGLDDSDAIELTAQRFARAGLPAPTLHKADLFEWAPGRRYDVVASFGFVEHFDDLEGVVRRHGELVAPGGTLIITLRNFTGAQYLLRRLLEPETLEKHCLGAMNVARLRAAMAPLPFDVLECGYHRTFDFWVDRDAAEMRPLERAVERGVRRAGAAATRLLGQARPTRLFSPYIVLVARRHGALVERSTRPPRRPALEYDGAADESCARPRNSRLTARLRWGLDHAVG